MIFLSGQEEARYQRHLIIDSFGAAAQQRLKDARVLVVGAGGLGSAVLQYLAAAGVGTLGIVEFDRVTISNLQRQVLYADSDLRKPKIEAAARRLRAMNPEMEVKCYPFMLSDGNAAGIFCGYDLAVDCTDNYPARCVIDRASRKSGIPMIYGTVQEGTGQVSVFNTPGAGGYCDLYPEEELPDDRSPVGVLSPLPGIVGSIQATEAIKLITGYGEPLVGRLLVLDAKTMEFKVFDL